MQQKLYYIVEVTHALTAEQARTEFPGVPWENLEQQSTVLNTPGYSRTFTGALGPSENPPRIRAWIRNLVTK